MRLSINSVNCNLWLDGHLYCTIALLTLFTISTAGCAFRYYDKETGVEHVLGFTHSKTKHVPENEGIRAVISQNELAGIGLDLGRDNYGVVAGWDRSRLVQALENTTTSIYWPTTSFFELRLGTNAPPSLSPVSNTSKAPHRTQK